MTGNGSDLLRYAMAASVQKLIIKPSSIPKNTETTGKY